jgi:DNA gyrase subunit A
MRVVIELRKDVSASIILNQLYKHTDLQTSFGIIMLALVNNEPRVLSLKDMLTFYIMHQEEVVTRRTQYDLNKALERDHILQGLLIALENIDEVIDLIKKSKNAQEAKDRLIERFKLSDAQATAIVEMRLKALTGLERAKLEEEHEELAKQIAKYREILGDKNMLLGVIRTEINDIADKYGDDRRSKIGYDVNDVDTEDLIPNENTVIAMSRLGYVKRMTVDNFKSQNRGGKGIKGMTTINDDYIEDLLMTTTHNYIMFFTNTGRVYRLKAYEVPEAGRTARGTAIVNLLQLAPGEKISAMIPIKEYDENKNLFMVTKKGIVKKTHITEYSHVRKTGLAAINLRDDDELIEVKSTTAESQIFIVTKDGMCIHFNESDVRATGRTAMGVIGMTLSDEDEVVGMQLNTQGDSLLIVSERGYGKRTSLDRFKLQRRGGKGMKCYKIIEKTGYVIGVKAVNDDHEIMMITNEGIIIQLRMEDIRLLDRNTSGVKLIDLPDKARVAQIAKVREKVSDGDQEFDNPDDAMTDISEDEEFADSDDDKEVTMPKEDSDESDEAEDEADDKSDNDSE